MENRFRMLSKSNPDAARTFFKQAQSDARARFALYQHLAGREFKPAEPAVTEGGNGNGNGQKQVLEAGAD